MARVKRKSTVLQTANKRLAGLKSITPVPNLGPNISVSGFGQDVDNLNRMLNAYNQHLATADQMQNDLIAEEQRVNHSNTRVLAAVLAQFGSDSNEYEQVGGKRLSDRKRRPKKSGPESQGTS